MGFKNDNIHIAEYDYDFAVDGGATGVFALSSKANVAKVPLEAIVIKVVTRVVTAFAGSGASAIIGNSSATNAYVATAAAATFAEDALFVDEDEFVVTAANLSDVVMTLSGAPLTAGKLKVLVEYMRHAD